MEGVIYYILIYILKYILYILYIDYIILYYYNIYILKSFKNELIYVKTREFILFEKLDCGTCYIHIIYR
jgi:hypothetical protein